MTDSKMTIEEARRVIAEHEAAQAAARKAAPAWQKAAKMVAAGWEEACYWPKIDRKVDMVKSPDGGEFHGGSDEDWEKFSQVAGITAEDMAANPDMDYDVFHAIIEMTEEY